MQNIDSILLIQCYFSIYTLIFANYFIFRVLDVSRNCFTLDTPAQTKIFHDGLHPLRSLQTLSVAFNKIMDRGCRVVCSIVKESFPALQILDFAGCFLTKHCVPTLEALLENKALNNDKPKEELVRRNSEDIIIMNEAPVELESTSNPQLREILMQENMFTNPTLAYR